MILIDQELFQTISSQAKQSAEKKYHHVLSNEKNSRVYRALIGFEPGAYVTPHKHSANVISETLVLLRGEAILLFFSDDGQIEANYFLSHEHKLLGIEVDIQKYHTIIPLKVSTVIFEIKERKAISPKDDETSWYDEKVNASWAPPAIEKEQTRIWMETVLKQLNIVFPEIY